MKFRTIKNTEHKYKGFIIQGRSMPTEGGYVLGGRHFVEGGTRRQYWIITPDGYSTLRCVIEKLKDAKKEIDDYIERKNNAHENS